MSRIYVFIPDTFYRRRIQQFMLSAVSPYYKALLRPEVPFLLLRSILSFSSLFPPEFPPHIVDLFFDCLEYPVSLSSFHHLVMFVRLCGFFLLPEDVIFTYLTTPIQSLPLYRAPFPLTWERHRNGYINFASDLCVIIPFTFLNSNTWTTARTCSQFWLKWRLLFAGFH